MNDCNNTNPSTTTSMAHYLQALQREADAAAVYTENPTSDNLRQWKTARLVAAEAFCDYIHSRNTEA